MHRRTLITTMVVFGGLGGYRMSVQLLVGRWKSISMRLRRNRRNKRGWAGWCDDNEFICDHRAVLMWVSRSLAVAVVLAGLVVVVISNLFDRFPCRHRDNHKRVLSWITIAPSAVGKIGRIWIRRWPIVKWKNSRYFFLSHFDCITSDVALSYVAFNTCIS